MGVMYYAAIVPCVSAALVSLQVAQLCGIHSHGYEIGPAALLGPATMVQTAVLGVLCALVSILFCKVMHASPRLYQKYFPSTMLRVTVGALLVLALTLLVGNQDYNGAGDPVIRRMLSGETIPEAFLLKILFTALTLGAWISRRRDRTCPVYRLRLWYLGRTAAGTAPRFFRGLGDGGRFLWSYQLPHERPDAGL